MKMFLVFGVVCLSLLLTGCSESEIEKEIEIGVQNSKIEKNTKAYIEVYPPMEAIVARCKDIMEMVWNWTKQSANMGETREMGVVFYIERHLTDGSWFGIKAGELQRGPIKNSADDRGTIELVYRGDLYCGSFHTHTPLCKLPDMSIQRAYGPSNTDRVEAERIGIPHFIYDYVQTVTYELPLNSPAALFHCGPTTRIK